MTTTTEPQSQATATGNDLELIQFKKAVFGKNKLIIDQSITMDEWRDLGQGLSQIQGSVQFWIADWMKYGDDKGFTRSRINSNIYDRLEDITGYSRQALSDIHYVDEAVSSRRREDLSFSHHREVAPLQPNQQEQLLTKAAEEKLSVRDLREEVKKTQDEKLQDALTLQKINEQLDWEKEIKQLAKQINGKYNKQQRNFLITQIKL